MGKIFDAGPTKVNPGEKKQSYFPVMSRPDGSSIGIPLLIVNGSEEGPVLFVSCATHGDEFDAVFAAIEVFKELDPGKLKGVFFAASVVDLSGFETHVSMDVSSMRESPVDQKEPMGEYPGNPEGTLTQRIAHVVCNELIPRANYGMDLHSGGDRGTSVALAGYFNVPGEFGAKSYEIAQQYPVELLWELNDSYKVCKVAQKAGVPFSLGEVTGEGRYREDDIRIYHTTIKNVMKHFKMLDGQPEDIPKNRKTVEAETYCYVKKGSGILKPFKKTGNLMEKNSILGVVMDVYGNEVEKILAPFDGIVTGIRTKPVVWGGEVAFLVSRFIK